MPQLHRKQKNKKEKSKIIETYIMHTLQNSECIYTSLWPYEM